MVHDYRLYHKGTANTSVNPRPLLYLTFGADGFDDDNNYYGDQSVLFLQRCGCALIYHSVGASAGVIERDAWDKLSAETKLVLEKWEVREGKGPGGLAGKPFVFSVF